MPACASALAEPPRADATDIEPGLTLGDLLDRAPRSPAIIQQMALRVALADEVEHGRVVLDDGQYRLVPDAFDGATLAALKALVL